MTTSAERSVFPKSIISLSSRSIETKDSTVNLGLRYFLEKRSPERLTSH